jgi:hypothetical protein
MKALWKLVLLLAMVSAIAVPASAQIDQGRLTGSVTDAQGGVLPGVTVTAKSPALIGVRTTVSEGDGKYSIASLPSGMYELTFELSGFQAFKRTNLILGLGQILTVDGQLQVASLQESVTVTGASPVVDMQSSKVGTDFTTDKLVGVPTATDIWAVLGQASGVRMNGFDVGGSHKSQQSGYESFGIRNQNRVLNDGVDTTEGTGGAGFYADFFSNEEVAVSAAGGDVEMNSPGSAVVNTIKSGGNKVKMLNNLTYQQESFVGDNNSAELSKRGYTGQPNIKFWEGHTDIGGPIKIDKVWFFGAYNHFKIDKQISGVPRDIATDLGVFDNYVTKETIKVSQKDTVVGYFQWGRKQKPNRGLSVTVSPEAAQPQDSVSWVYKGQHSRVWSNRLFTDVKVNLFGYDFPLGVKADYKTQPPKLDTGTNFVSGAAWDAFDLARQKPAVTAQATYYVPAAKGSHDLKVGFEYLLDISKYAVDGRSGPIRYRELNGATNEIMFVDVGDNANLGSSWRGSNDRDQRYAGYAQDRWNPNSRATITMGLRWDYQRPYYLDGQRDPLIKDVLTASSGSLAGQPMFVAQTTPSTNIFTRNSIAPRLGISYDVTGKGNTVLKGFYGRYYYNYADSFGNLNPGGANYKTFKFLDQNGNRKYDGPSELGLLSSSSGGTSTTVNPDMKKPYADEFDLSAERQFWGESSVRVAYVLKKTANEFATINQAREGQFTVPTVVTVDTRDFVNGITGRTSYTLMDIPAGLPVRNVIDNVPDGNYRYDTLQFAFNKRFGSGLFIQSSFDYQWRDELRGGAAATVNSTATLSAPSTSPLNSDPITVGYFQNVYPQVSNRQSSTNWQGRAIARYVFKYDIGVATNLRVQSGYAYSRIIAATLPNAGAVRFYEQNIENNRSDTVPILDLRVDKAFKVGSKYKVTGMFDAFNLTNSAAVTNFNLTNGASYNQIIAALDPRTLQFGIRFDF